MNGQPLSRRLVASLLALWLIGATVAPPLLDAAEDVLEAQIEAEHDPSTCAPLHDHEACSQLAKSFGRVAWGATNLRRPDAVLRSLPQPTAPATRFGAVTLLPPTRAPPTPSS